MSELAEFTGESKEWNNVLKRVCESIYISKLAEFTGETKEWNNVLERV